MIGCVQARDLNVNLVFSTTIVAFGLSFLYGYNIGVLNQPKQVAMAIASSRSPAPPRRRLIQRPGARSRRLYILCWRRHSRRKLSPTLSTPTTLVLTTLVAQCELSRR